jgi:hypothetical protein
MKPGIRQREFVVLGAATVAHLSQGPPRRREAGDQAGNVEPLATALDIEEVVPYPVDRRGWVLRRVTSHEGCLEVIFADGALDEPAERGPRVRVSGEPWRGRSRFAIEDVARHQADTS